MAEADGGGTILRRYGPATGSTSRSSGTRAPATTDRRWLHADERGSIVSVSDASGNMLGINTYDEYGKPGASNIGRFQYTGQKWLPELGLYDYKAPDVRPGARPVPARRIRSGMARGRTSMPMCGAIQ